MSYNPFPQPTDVVVNTGIGTSAVSILNPLPVSLGSSSITIIGDITIPGIVSVTSSIDNPIHNHIVEVGTSSTLTTPYMPIGVGLTNLNLSYLPVGISSLLNTVSVSNTAFYVTGVGGTVNINGTVSVANTVSISNTAFYVTNPVTTVAVSSITSPVTVQGTVGIGTTGQVSLNLNNSPVSSSNPLPVTGNVAIQTNTYVTINPDTTSADAFGRNRVAEPFTLGDYKHIYGLNVDFLDSQSGAGSTVSFKSNQACARLVAGIGSTAYSIHQTRAYHHYQPGKSQLIFSSFNFFAPQQNSTKRTGYFDDRDGIYLEQVGLSTSNGIDVGIGTHNWVIRSYTSGIATETRIPQSQWNKDKCDGTGISGFNIDFTKTQLAFIDFQWLGVGRVRCGFAHNGQLIVAHEFNHSNSFDKVYISNPNLPVRCEIRNTGVGVGASMDQICATVVSEGGYAESGIDFSHTMIATRSTPTPAGTELPLIAFRLKNTFNTLPNRMSVKLNTLSLYAETNSISFRVVRLSGNSNIGVTTLGQGTVWTSAGDNSGVEYCENATVYNDGDEFASGFVPAGASQNSLSPVTLGSVTGAKKNVVRQNINSNDSEIYVIIVRTITTQGNAQANVAASIQWREIY